jgi:hypothetical protein
MKVRNRVYKITPLAHERSSRVQRLGARVAETRRTLLQNVCEDILHLRCPSGDANINRYLNTQIKLSLGT